MDAHVSLYRDCICYVKALLLRVINACVSAAKRTGCSHGRQKSYIILDVCDLIGNFVTLGLSGNFFSSLNGRVWGI